MMGLVPSFVAIHFKGWIPNSLSIMRRLTWVSNAFMYILRTRESDYPHDFFYSKHVREH